MMSDWAQFANGRIGQLKMKWRLAKSFYQVVGINGERFRDRINLFPISVLPVPHRWYSM